MLRDERLALAVADVHGLDTAGAHSIVGAGWTNHVVVLGSPPSQVVRYAIDPADDGRIGMEAWVLPRVAALGIPCPTVIVTGELDGVSYIVEEFVAGARGPDRASTALWHTLGRYAVTMGAAPLGADAPDVLFTRFGRDLPVAWQRHLEYGLDQLTDDDPLLRLGVYEPAQQPVIRAIVAELAQMPLTQGLGHGDLTLANVLVPDHQPPVVIDWGAAGVGPSPWADLIQLHRNRRRDGVTDEQLKAFTEGCGLTLGEADAAVADLMLLGDLDLVRWARDRAPHRLPEVIDTARQTVRRVAGRRG